MEVGQTIGLRRLSGWAFRPRNFMKNRGAANPGWGPAFERVQPAESRLQARLPAPHRWHRGHAGGFSTLSQGLPHGIRPYPQYPIVQMYNAGVLVPSRILSGVAAI